MTAFDKLGSWLSETVLGPHLVEFFSGRLGLLGISAASVALLAPLLSIVVAKFFWKALELPPEVPWDKLNPGDLKIMQGVFDYQHTLDLAVRLNEIPAATLEEFVDQVRRLGLYGKHPLYGRLNADDEEQMRSLFSKPDTVRLLGEKLNELPARSLDELCSQVRRLSDSE